jgi:hypothetical protein
MRSIANTTLDPGPVLGPHGANSADFCYLVWSPAEKFISPRPLGATHIVYYAAMDPSDVASPVDDQRSLFVVAKETLLQLYTEVAELPINLNDLLFVYLFRDSGQSFRPIPRRLHKENASSTVLLMHRSGLISPYFRL